MDMGKEALQALGFLSLLFLDDFLKFIVFVYTLYLSLLIAFCLCQSSKNLVESFLQTRDDTET